MKAYKYLKTQDLESRYRENDTLITQKEDLENLLNKVRDAKTFVDIISKSGVIQNSYNPVFENNHLAVTGEWLKWTKSGYFPVSLDENYLHQIFDHLKENKNSLYLDILQLEEHTIKLMEEEVQKNMRNYESGGFDYAQFELTKNNLGNFRRALKTEKLKYHNLEKQKTKLEKFRGDYRRHYNPKR